MNETWVINCWIYGSNPFGDVPDCVLGPYATRHEASLANPRLTCTSRIERVRWRLDPPEWALLDLPTPA